jgi:N-succinyldiaminopimelate aminotransferase
VSDRPDRLVARLRPHASTIFTEMSELAVAHGAVNLGQGAPDFSGPEEVLEVAVAAIRAGHNQYAPGWGVPTLRDAVAEHQQRWYGLDVDPSAHEVVVTAGATEAVTAAVLGLCEPGDEVVAFEPTYDSYAAACAIAGVRLVPVPLEAPDWTFDPDRLRAAITPRTRLVLVNTPHNPTGRVLTAAELEAVADVVHEHDLVAVTDEVYEHLWFAGHRHVPLATLRGMRERTLTIGSGGKTFSVTGWKVGWATGPADLVRPVHAAKQWLSFSNATPQQHAIAHALRLPDAWFDGYRSDYATRRAVLLAALSDVGLEAATPQGTYFVLLDARQLVGERADAAALCRRLPALAGVAAVPVSALTTDGDAVRPWLRLAFCKEHDAIREGVARLVTVRG